MNTNNSQVSLIEAWLYYCVAHNCPKGRVAQRFLRGLIAKGVVADKDVWNAAPESIKDAFYEQFGYMPLPAKARRLSEKLAALNSLRERGPVKTNKSIREAVDKNIKVVSAALKLAIPKDLYPQGYAHDSGIYKVPSVRWPKSIKK